MIKSSRSVFVAKVVPRTVTITLGRGVLFQVSITSPVIDPEFASWARPPTAIGTKEQIKMSAIVLLRFQVGTCFREVPLVLGADLPSHPFDRFKKTLNVIPWS